MLNDRAWQDLLKQALTEIAVEDAMGLERRLDSADPPVQGEVLESVFQEHRKTALKLIRRETAKKGKAPLWRALGAAACFLVMFLGAARLLAPAPDLDLADAPHPALSPAAAFADIPEEWTGNYYMAFVPSGSPFVGVISMESAQTASYGTTEGGGFGFTEHQGEIVYEAQQENAAYEYVNLSSGAVALAVTDGENITLVWNMGDQTLVVDAWGMDGESVASIASSVRKIRE